MCILKEETETLSSKAMCSPLLYSHAFCMSSDDLGLSNVPVQPFYHHHHHHPHVSNSAAREILQCFHAIMARR